MRIASPSFLPSFLCPLLRIERWNPARSSNVIDEIELETTSTSDSLGHLYSNYKEAQQRDPASILRSLARQAALSPQDFPAAMLDQYLQPNGEADLSKRPSTTECKLLLIKLTAGFLHTTIVLDALGECEPSTCEQLLDVRDCFIVAAPARPAVKVLVTSRDVYIQDPDNAADIACDVRVEIAECIRRGKLLGGDVRALEDGANGMYVLARALLAPRFDPPPPPR